MKFLASHFFTVFTFVLNGHPIFADEDETYQWPPKETAIVKAFSFSGGPTTQIVQDGKLNPSARHSPGLTLSLEQTRHALEALNATAPCPLVRYACFEPKDALVFFDENENVLASVNICFTCYRSQSAPEQYPTFFHYGRLASFFSELKLESGYDFTKVSATDYNARYNQKILERREKTSKRWTRPEEAETSKTIKPSEKIILNPGDRVFVASDVPCDPFDGLLLIDKDGFVVPKFCKDPIKIGGLSEATASSWILAHTVEQEVFKSGVSVVALKASRLQAPAKIGRQ